MELVSAQESNYFTIFRPHDKFFLYYGIKSNK
jgi:hypothetical protein